MHFFFWECTDALLGDDAMQNEKKTYLHGGALSVESRHEWTDINGWTNRSFYTGRDRMGTNNLTPPSRYSGLDQGRAECEEEPCMDKRFAAVEWSNVHNNNCATRRSPCVINATHANYGSAKREKCREEDKYSRDWWSSTGTRNGLIETQDYLPRGTQVWQICLWRSSQLIMTERLESWWL
jgi:hypothetical protein